MTRFLKRILVFSIPILIYCGFIVVVDPFAYFNWFSVIAPKTKRVTAKALNECLWKMNEFDRHPEASILLGDSRMDAMPADKVTGVTNRKYFNFGFGGASVKEMTDAFWFAANRTRLSDVYIGLNLNV